MVKAGDRIIKIDPTMLSYDRPAPDHTGGSRPCGDQRAFAVVPDGPVVLAQDAVRAIACLGWSQLQPVGRSSRIAPNFPRRIDPLIEERNSGGAQQEPEVGELGAGAVSGGTGWSRRDSEMTALASSKYAVLDSSHVRCSICGRRSEVAP
jgi:hypothetical protein